MIRTRFAPSPTGSLHVGNARIAVLNWLLTRKHGGTFILRIEDTDSDRNVAGAESGILDDLLWLGLEWDEGPDRGQGDCGPYRQSERSAFYWRYADRLLESGHAYYCVCTRDDAQTEAHPEHRERCACAGMDVRATEQARAVAAVVRFRVPDAHRIIVNDEVRGRIEVESGQIADFVLLRSDARPTYNFAVVVDDIEMRITHVIRGVGHLSNTPRQVLLYEALGRPAPAFVHVPMVLGEDRQKLSKRHGAAGMAEYRAAGYHPDAMVNYLSLLSWASRSGDEVLGRQRLMQEITLDRIGVADVIFDPAKLRWLSSKHIELMDLDALVAAVRPCVDASRYQLDDARLRSAVAATRTHLGTFCDINAQLDAFFPGTEGDSAGGDAAEGRAVVAAAAHILTGLESWDEESLKAAVQTTSRETQQRGRALYEPLRLALTGREHGPPLPAVLFVQGRDVVLRRLRQADG